MLKFNFVQRFFLVLALFSTVLFTSCDNDDDDASDGHQEERKRTEYIQKDVHSDPLLT